MKTRSRVLAAAAAASMAAFLMAHEATAQQTKARRNPDALKWSDAYNAVPRGYETGQEVCNVRAALIDIPGELVFQQTNEYSGQCVIQTPRGPYSLGYPVRGQGCLRNYSIVNSIVYLGNRLRDDGSGELQEIGYGPGMYCESTWPYVDRWHDKPQVCSPSGGNPIFPLTGNKRQKEDLIRWSPNLPPLSVTYDNRRMLPNSDAEGAFLLVAPASFGSLWESNFHKRVVTQQSGREAGYFSHAQASRGSGAWVSFIRGTPTGEPQAPDSDIADRIVRVGAGWRYTDASAMSQETYDNSGLLTQVVYARGGKLTYTYSDASTPASVAPVAGLLIHIRDQHERAVRFEYEQVPGGAAPRIARVIDPDDRVIHVAYDTAGNLSRLTWPDGYVRQFAYEQTALPWALTGIVDENAQRHSTYGYDAEGRAVSTEYAGGVNRYSISHTTPPSWVTTETFDSVSLVQFRDHRWLLPEGAVMTTPNGTSASIDATLVNGMPRMTSRSQPAGAGCDPATSHLTYDANGNVSSRTDFNGSKSCSAYDLNRNLQTAKLNGLDVAEACPADIAGHAVPAEGTQRKTTTQWHLDWALPVKRAEPKKITTSVYNGQPDPTAGNAIASCAPTTAVLPDNKRIAALCKKVEQATTDATGTQGFSATPIGIARTWTYSYNQHGQVLTERDPRNNLTTYAYYSDTNADHTQGDLQSVTNAAGHATQYTRYDRSGRLLRSVDPNGAVTETTYTPRAWVSAITVTRPGGGSAQVTSYEYDGVGQLKVATLPDSTKLEYRYDAAHRLTGIKDAAGNTVTYTLDNMGNRTAEQITDPSGALARSIERAYDALNRVQSVSGEMQ